MQTFGKIDSKFRYVILASKRAKQLLRGAKVKIKSKSKNVIRIAQLEVKLGLVDYEIIQSLRDDAPEVEEQVLSVDDGVADLDEAGVGEGLADDELGEGDVDEHAGNADYDEELPDEVVGEVKDDE